MVVMVVPGGANGGAWWWHLQWWWWWPARGGPLLCFFLFFVLFVVRLNSGARQRPFDSVSNRGRRQLLFLSCVAVAHGKDSLPCVCEEGAPQRDFTVQKTVVRPLSCASIENARQRVHSRRTAKLGFPVVVVVESSRCAGELGRRCCSRRGGIGAVDPSVK
jgi:hypothetical protein